MGFCLLLLQSLPEVTPEEFAIYRQTGQLPNEGSEQVQHHQGKGMKQDGILAKLGRNLGLKKPVKENWIWSSDA